MPKAGFRHSEESRKKMVTSHLGIKLSEDHKKKISIGGKGKIIGPQTREKLRKNKLLNNPMKGRTGQKHHMWGKTHTEEAKLKISLSKTGKKRKPYTELTRKKLSLVKLGTRNPMYGRKGSKSPRWKGGIYPAHLVLRKSLEYRLWRKSVFERDGFKCQWCGDSTSGNLEADHIQPFSIAPELRLAIDNGRTLCKACHKKRHQKK